MNKLLIPLLLSNALSLPMLAYAGSPDGLDLLVLNADNATAYRNVVQEYFNRYNPSHKGFSCDNALLNIANVNMKNAPKHINAGMAIEATQKKDVHKNLTRALKDFRDTKNSRGFDGVVVYEVQGKNLKFYGISAADQNDVFTSKVPLEKLSDQSLVNMALCKAIIHLPVLIAP